MDLFSVGVELADGGAFTIRLQGEIDLAARPAIAELIEACVEAGATAIRFDMREVTLCGSDCVYLLIHARRLDVPVSVIPSRQVLRTLEIAGLPPEFVAIEHP